ncbi:uncharacterized protein BKA55DRAFT_572734 [Fusarium redolens]|uniref:Chromo shadow domain-containing protein n=1 Tax=Fusarium redolens TaxID=48865 RepID=A0A9P9K834_FUSRE|nr:uncharacterized protein BKA55DRAFT_572734 [Fusarium redolens]KAH7247661.1 hypothetical protein BKA55DRAFT_572734 [Fusarium redolens]
MHSALRKRKVSRVIRVSGATKCRIGKKWLDGKRKETRYVTKEIKKQSISNKTSYAKHKRPEAVTNKARHISIKEETRSKPPKQVQQGKLSATANKFNLPALPSGSWEDKIEKISLCEGKVDSRGCPVVYTIWKDERKAKFDWHTICKKCPKKLGHFMNDLLDDSS